jgi:hypothetical protein
MPVIFAMPSPDLGHQNNAKQFTMMQQICAKGPLHLPEECVILAEYIYRN